MNVEKNEMRAKRADQFGATVCFNGFQMFGDKTPQVCHPIRKYMFFLSVVHA